MVAKMSDGRIIRGESSISKAGGKIDRLYLEPGTPSVYPAARAAILNAQLVVVGLGSLPVCFPILVPGVVEAFENKLPTGFTLQCHDTAGRTDGTRRQTILRLSATIPGEIFDTVLINDNLDIPCSLLINMLRRSVW